MNRAQSWLDELKDIIAKTGLQHRWVGVLQRFVTNIQQGPKEPENDTERANGPLQPPMEVTEEILPG